MTLSHNTWNCHRINMFYKIHAQCVLFSLCVLGISGTSVQMRVVKELANYGYFGPNPGENENIQPTSSIPPANFSGPSLLKRLMGKCYNLTQEQYRYTFCPFQNFTQYELSSRWNAFHGILGIWSHWNITNNVFHSMVYTQGDRCGDIERKVHVLLQCGSIENLTNVSEPSRCQYTAIFQTRYVCHNDSLLVYPRLPDELQRKWDQLWTEFRLGDITEKGYHYGLEKIFQSAGLSETAVSVPAEIKVTTESSMLVESLFSDLPTCNKEYGKIAKEITRLNNEISALKLMLDLSKVETRKSKPHQ